MSDFNVVETGSVNGTFYRLVVRSDGWTRCFLGASLKSAKRRSTGWLRDRKRAGEAVIHWVMRPKS